MRNVKLKLSYDGADFSGWQVQPDRRTVQGVLAEALARVTGECVMPQGSGRTDAGVHALAQVASLELASPIPMPNLVAALNDVLPASIRVTQAEAVPPEFHARTSAKAKTYRYRIYRGPICPPFLARYVCHCPWPLHEAAMGEASSVVMGTHDFSSFAAVDPERLRRIQAGNTANESESQGTSPTNIRSIFRSEFLREGEELIYVVRGSGFLHHMVRNLVGTFLLVGRGALPVIDVTRILQARARSANPGATAPASGLYLVEVEYERQL